MARATILVVEDDPAIRRGVADALEFAGFVVREAGDGQQGLEAACSGAFDLVLLDILMPKMDGLTMLGELRKARPSLPVIMLTAKGEERDKVQGLKRGADDYVVKPFGPDELIARVEAVLRRSAERPVASDDLSIAGRRVDFERRELTLQDGAVVSLTEREAEVLRYLAENRGRAVSRDELLSRVWGIDPRGVQSRTVDMAVARLREHLRDDPADPAVIVTVRGRGYMLAPENSA
ncbi:MAG: response regulator transcription factor [Phycisphaeraceae bacterium]|nr:response regulator transcription factor [Phycisphaeraceae bacterium]